LNNSSNTTYHFRAVGRNSTGNTVYGQNMTFTPGSTTASLNVSKTVRNLSSGSAGFSTTTYANPLDVVMFMITIQSNNNQDLSNVNVRDTLPANLIYKGNVIVSGNSNYSGDITSGMNFGTISSNQTITITYQAQVAAATNFSYGTTTLTNNVSLTCSNLTNTPTSNASVIVTRATVYGASTVSTGLTNNFWTDSFLLPLMIALGGLWMIKSGMFFGLEKWVYNKRKNSKTFRTEKELDSRIAKIRELEKI
jgi:fimbrial isopeptide formation D2 family protein